MKTSLSAILLLFISFAGLGSENNLKQQQKENLVATYNGETEDEKFSFSDADGKVVLFDKISETIELELLDDENIGKKFSITWEKESEPIYDEDGEETGKTIIIKGITELKII